MLTKYMNPKNVRRETTTNAGKMRGGKLYPVSMVPFRESESGVINQSIFAELEPVAGRMITPVGFEVVSVYVPTQASHAIMLPDTDYPGNTEMVREHLLKGEALFGTEEEHELSKAMRINPRSINGEKRVCTVVKYAHNAAVNYLRQSKYVRAELIDKNNESVTPALLGSTILQRLGAVLDPDDRIGGQVQMEIRDVKLPVNGIAFNQDHVRTPTTDVRETSNYIGDSTKHTTATPMIRTVINQEEGNRVYPSIWAEGKVVGGKMSLNDFYTAETVDRLVRDMRKLVDDNPQYGEEIVARYAHGMSVDLGKTPFVIYRKNTVFGASIERPMDGASLGDVRTNNVVQIDYTVPVPPTELGGMVVTFITVKPDETIPSQPHPVLSEAYTKRNYVADEVAIDPEPVMVRQLHSDCEADDEESVAFYMGSNHLHRNYSSYGFARNVDLDTVENKTALWQLEVPMSVTPQSVIYPDDLDHYPFADQEAECCTFTVSTFARVDTPLLYGPSPVEELEVLNNHDVFANLDAIGILPDKNGGANDGGGGTGNGGSYSGNPVGPGDPGWDPDIDAGGVGGGGEA